MKTLLLEGRFSSPGGAFDFFPCRPLGRPVLVDLFCVLAGSGTTGRAVAGAIFRRSSVPEARRTLTGRAAAGALSRESSASDARRMLLGRAAAGAVPRTSSVPDARRIFAGRAAGAVSGAAAEFTDGLRGGEESAELGKPLRDEAETWVDDFVVEVREDWLSSLDFFRF